MGVDYVILAALALAVVWLALRVGWLGQELRRAAQAPDDSMRLLQREVEAVRSGVDVRLSEQLELAHTLNERLGRLQRTTEEVGQLGSRLAELQAIFRPAQQRGAFGERLLEEALADVLPRERFRLQYTYPVTGVRVDAAVLLNEGQLLPIDSKFPLDNFLRAFDASSPINGVREAAERAFGRDVRKHVDDIADKYISRDDGAIDIALMYIPSERVLHELARATQGSESLISYALKRSVIPVSPNTLYAYLSVVRMGLRGYSLRKSARRVLEHLMHLRTDVDALRAELNRATRQARHSLNNLADAERALLRVEERLEGISKQALEQE